MTSTSFQSRAAQLQSMGERLHYAVTLDDDSGAEIEVLGAAAHRFFFSPSDVEPLPAQELSR